MASQMVVAEDIRPANDDDNVAVLALAHGRYEAEGAFLGTDAVPRVVNRAVTVIDDWIDDGVFDRRHVRVIEIARSLWRDIRSPRHPFFDPPDLEDRDDGFDSERAKNLLRRCKHLVGADRWAVFENVIRWNEPTGIPGSRAARLSAASIAAAKSIVRDVADEVRPIL